MEQQEYRYRLLLRCLLHPIGAPDTRKNCSPEELVKHVTKIFDINEETHQRLVDEEQLDKPVSLHVSKISAQLLKSPDHLENVNPYCIISLVTRINKHQSSTFYGNIERSRQEAQDSNKQEDQAFDKSKSRSLPRIFNNDGNIAPAGQHHGSHGALQNPRSKKTIYSQIEVRRTSSLLQAIEPTWHEQFEIGIGNVQEEEIQVYVWDSKKQVPGAVKSEKSTGIRSLLKMMKNSFDHWNPLEDMIGYFSIPVRDIPSAGCEQWFPLYAKRKGGAPICGKIHMSMILRAKHLNEGSEPDGVESDQCSLEDFYDILKILHVASAKEMKNQEQKFYSGHLQTVSQVVTRHFCAQNHIQKLTRQIIECAILMEWNKSPSFELSGLAVESNSILSLLDDLFDETKTAADWEVVHDVYRSLDDILSVNQFEMDLFDQAACWFAEDYLSTKEAINVSLFPIDSSNKLEIRNKLRVVESLLKLELTSEEMSYKKIVVDHLTSKVQRDVYVKLDAILKAENTGERDGEKAVMKNVTTLVSNCIETSQDALHNNIIFSNVQFDYAVTLATAMDEKIAHISQDIISKMDKYLTKYQCYDINVKEGSKASLRLYFALKNLHRILDNICHSRKNGNRTELSFKPKQDVALKLKNYSDWFHSQFQFWLQTYRNECFSRTERAVEADSSPTLVEEGSQISVSCVDAISCFTQVCSEWKTVEFDNADLNLVAVTKLTDGICDGARHYVKQLLRIAQKLSDNEPCDLETSNKCCLLINNMEHVRRFLPTIPEILQWESVVDNISHEEDAHQLRVQALKTLSRLLKCAERDIRGQLDTMLSKIGTFLSSDIQICIQKWTDPVGQIQEVDSLLKGLDENLQNLHSRLKDSIFTPLLMELWKIILQHLDKCLLSGESPEYAEVILKNLLMVKDYFLQLGLGEKEISNNYVYQNLYQKLQYNAMSTIDLQLAYLKNLADNMDTPADYYGHLSVKFGYQQENPGTYVLHVYILRAVHLPGLDQSGFSDPYVSLELLPKQLFPTFSKQKTIVAKETLNPVFNQLFVIRDVPSESFNTPGATLRLTIKDFDTFGSNDFAGEIFIHLTKGVEMSKLVSVEFVPALMLPLKRPVDNLNDGALQALKDRRKWDKEAKAFVARRMKVIMNQRERTDNKAPKKISGGLFSLMNYSSLSPAGSSSS